MADPSLHEFLSKLKPPHLIAINGSNRGESLNGKLLKAATTLAEAQGATVEFIDLNELGAPRLQCCLAPTESLRTQSRELVVN